MRRAVLGGLALAFAATLAAANDFSALPSEVRLLLAPAQPLWPQLDADTRQDLQANARDWLSRVPADREALRARVRAWDQLPATERAARRAPYLAWQGLSAAERAQLRVLATEFAVLPSEQQYVLRAAFAQQSFDAQRGWSLGPTFGAQLATLAPMFAYVPEAERGQLFALLRGLDASASADLVLLLPRLDNSGRERLRVDLQSAAAGDRAEVIRRRLDRQ